jgi:hypothetical protein
MPLPARCWVRGRFLRHPQAASFEPNVKPSSTKNEGNGMPKRKKKKKNKNGIQVVTQCGTMWERNEANMEKIPSSRKGARGVYILFDGSMPMYVGKGNIKHRIYRADESKLRGQLWDHFSWYAVKEPKLMHDIEVLMLRMLAPNLR